jgi:O-methyltransferase
MAAPRSVVTVDRCYVLHTLMKQALTIGGDIVECGVYRGGTAAMMARMIIESGRGQKIYLFDTFGGMPKTDEMRDWHQEGDFSDTSLAEVAAFVGAPGIAIFRKGLIPDAFAGLERLQIAFAHIDVDIYRSVLNSIEFIWPWLTPVGFVVFDDYGFASCPEARQAVDEFFMQTPAQPLCLSTGQAIVFKH